MTPLRPLLGALALSFAVGGSVLAAGAPARSSQPPCSPAGLPRTLGRVIAVEANGVSCKFARSQLRRAIPLFRRYGVTKRVGSMRCVLYPPRQSDLTGRIVTYLDCYRGAHTGPSPGPVPPAREVIVTLPPHAGAQPRAHRQR